MNPPVTGKLPWYKDGLRFSCTQCGRCCKGPNPGHVWVNRREIEAIAASLQLSVQQFGRSYLRKIGHQYSLIEKSNKDCIFWNDDVGCEIYKDRPSQCRQFPFWPEIMESRSDWEREAKQCPGMNQGRTFTMTQIQSILDGDADTRATFPSSERPDGDQPITESPSDS